MEIIHQVAALRARLSQQLNIALVPTMGNLHAGHLDLVRQARALGQCVVVSIFVNPLQFGPNEDFDRYPRTLAADCALLDGLADIVFAPDVNEMYPQPQTIFVEPPLLANEFCGVIRPGHFRGMATVVLKLLNLVQPQFALFGKKIISSWRLFDKWWRSLICRLKLWVVKRCVPVTVWRCHRAINIWTQASEQRRRHCSVP